MKLFTVPFHLLIRDWARISISIRYFKDEQEAKRKSSKYFFVFLYRLHDFNLFSVKRICVAYKRIFLPLDACFFSSSCVIHALCIMNENRGCRDTEGRSKNSTVKRKIFITFFPPIFTIIIKRCVKGCHACLPLCILHVPVIHLGHEGGKPQLNIRDRWYHFKYERLNTVEIIKIINKTYIFKRYLEFSGRNFHAHMCEGGKIWIFHLRGCKFSRRFESGAKREFLREITQRCN